MTRLPQVEPFVWRFMCMVIGLFCLVVALRSAFKLRRLSQQLRRIEKFRIWLETAADDEVDHYASEAELAGRDWEARGPWEKLS